MWIALLLSILKLAGRLHMDWFELLLVAAAAHVVTVLTRPDTSD